MRKFFKVDGTNLILQTLDVLDDTKDCSALTTAGLQQSMDLTKRIIAGEIYNPATKDSAPAAEDPQVTADKSTISTLRAKSAGTWTLADLATWLKIRG